MPTIDSEQHRVSGANGNGLLVALGPQRLNGRELAARYKDRAGKTISYGTLYTTMGRLKDAGWVEQVDSEAEDGRLRHFRLTGNGLDTVNKSRTFYWRLLGLPEGNRA